MGKNMLKLDTSGFDYFVSKLQKLNADLKPIFTDALTQAAETITEDTLEGVKDQYLPAHGEYHRQGHPTEKSIVTHPEVVWQGVTAEVAVGFDFSKPGAGGFLITGTPRMRPDKKLNQIYKGKRYMSQIKKDMEEVFQDAIDKYMRG